MAEQDPFIADIGIGQSPIHYALPSPRDDGEYSPSAYYQLGDESAELDSINAKNTHTASLLVHLI